MKNLLSNPARLAALAAALAILGTGVSGYVNLANRLAAADTHTAVMTDLHVEHLIDLKTADRLEGLRLQLDRLEQHLVRMDNQLLSMSRKESK